MKFSSRILLATLPVLFLTNCASIVSKSNWPFSVETNPSGAKVVITNKRGREIYKGRTPAALKLKSGAGFFVKESYTIALSMDGYESKKINLECKINGWYFGNILIGGVIGMLIIDPATGAMYKLDNEGITENLNRTLPATSTSLNVLDKNQIPDDWASHLVKIN